jgi:DNA-binding PadR family transcriptional regulator
MSLEHAILGFLNYQPFTGYDLKKTFDASVRHFWPADQSQIYRTLARLQEEGKARVEVIDQSDRPDRKVFHITPTGKEELLRWLTSTLEVESARSPQMIQVFFAASLPDEAVLKLFEEGAAYMRQALAMYDSFPPVVEEFARQLGTPRDAFFWGLTVESGQAMARSSLEWMESVISRIKTGQLPPHQ